jgi:hypothetical protein
MELMESFSASQSDSFYENVINLDAAGIRDVSTSVGLIYPDTSTY